MRHSLKATFLAAAVLFLPRSGDAATLPWKQAGLSEREAAAHLLNRFAYGPRPGEVDAVVKMGLDAWLERQLAGLPDAALEDRLTGRLPTLARVQRAGGLGFRADGAARSTEPSPASPLKPSTRAGTCP